jgi:hypothetical protein
MSASCGSIPLVVSAAIDNLGSVLPSALQRQTQIKAILNRPKFAGGSKVSMDGADGKK